MDEDPGFKSRSDVSAELIAYLDGELDAESSKRLERKLVEDESLRALLREYQQSWDMLDDLPRITASDDFQRLTVETVALSTLQVASSRETSSRETSSRRVPSSRRSRKWDKDLWRGSIALLTAASVLTGYAVISRILGEPNRRLAQDLPVIEQLDLYRHADSVEFLRDLASTDLFSVEERDAP